MGKLMILLRREFAGAVPAQNSFEAFTGPNVIHFYLSIEIFERINRDICSLLHKLGSGHESAAKAGV